MLLHVHIDHKDYNLGRGAQDGHLDVHTQLLSVGSLHPCSSSLNSELELYVHGGYKDYWGRGAQDGHLDFHTQLLSVGSLHPSSSSLLYVHLDFHTAPEL